MTESLYVLIPTYGRAPLLGRTLSSLASCVLPACYRETIVVENGPKAGAEAIVAAADTRLRARYVHVEKANKSNALNEALKMLPDEALVVYLDDDVRLDPNVLTAYANAAVAGERCYFGGPLSVDYEVAPPEWLIAHLPASAVGWEPAEDEEVRAFFGANWAARVGDVKAAGGYDVRRGPGTSSVGQEYEMQWRLKESGLTPMYVPGALVWHYVPQERCSPEWLLKRAYRIGTSMGRKWRSEQPPTVRNMARQVVKWFGAAPDILRKADSDAVRFEARYNLIRKTGFVRGYVFG